MIKAIFFDVDGTLVSHSISNIPQSTKQALQKLQQNGIKIFLATGRHLPELEDLHVQDIPFDGYVLINGQLCLDSNQNIIFEQPIPKQDNQKLRQIFEDKKIPTVIIDKNGLYSNFMNPTIIQAQADVSSPVPKIQEYHSSNVYQYTIYTNELKAQNILSKLENCTMTKWNPYAFDIIPSTGGKSAGILKTIEHYGIQQNEVMAFGDGENDIEMLKWAHIGVAMGNADENVKKNANYITTHIDEDGIDQALKHFNLI